MVPLARLLVLAATLAACRGDNSDTGGEDDGTTGATADDPCGVCVPGGYAVDCGYAWGLGEDTVCGINKDNAEYLCISMWAGVIKSSPSDNCSPPSEPWNPSHFIYRDPTVEGITTIESELLDQIEHEPHSIFLDQTRLDWNDTGEVFLATPGELSTALGLLTDDVLIDVNGYSFTEILGTPQLYFGLRAAELLELRIERSGELMTLTYRID